MNVILVLFSLFVHPITIFLYNGKGELLPILVSVHWAIFKRAYSKSSNILKKVDDESSVDHVHLLWYILLEIKILFPEVSYGIFVWCDSSFEILLTEVGPECIREIVLWIRRLIQEIPRMSNTSSGTDDKIWGRKFASVDVSEKCFFIEWSWIDPSSHACPYAFDDLILTTISDRKDERHRCSLLGPFFCREKTFLYIFWEHRDVPDRFKTDRFSY